MAQEGLDGNLGAWTIGLHPLLEIVDGLSGVVPARVVGQGVTVALAFAIGASGKRTQRFLSRYTSNLQS